MYNFNQEIHFVGIGGVGMAGIAEVLLNLGYRVTGSDIKRNDFVKHLEQCGAHVSIPHAAANITESTSVVVVSSAVPVDNIELETARDKGVPIIPRAEMLSELMRMKYGIAVAGSHGKTTTTTMVGEMLRRADLDPTVIVGGRVLSERSGARAGLGKYIVAESDESDGSFCLLRPSIAIVTNIDSEHLNHYGSFGALEDSFSQFMSSVPFYGLVVACFDDPVVRRLASQLKRRVVSYGLSPDHDLFASDIVCDGPVSSFTLYVSSTEAGRFQLPTSGVHNVCNALASVAVGVELGLSAEQAVRALEDFPGVARRNEIVSETDGITVLDDYAHHPSEIKATLAALRNGWLPHTKEKNSTDDAKIYAIFQPHRYSRTRELFSSFVTAFGDADEVIVGEIYPAGEEPIEGIDGSHLASSIQHENVQFVSDLSTAVSGLGTKLRPGDLVVTLGAGNVGSVARELASALSS
ncbi:UDP-N-acetylmuramate--L-alanine ligase [bacterium J17]|nr:UDP-N-acetylmuramate--L-alanine ligase [bacterium J17]